MGLKIGKTYSWLCMLFYGDCFALPFGSRPKLKSAILANPALRSGTCWLSRKYLALFNTGFMKTRVKAKFSELGITGPCRARDLWAHQDLGEFSGSFARELRAHEAGLYRLDCGSSH